MAPAGLKAADQASDYGLSGRGFLRSANAGAFSNGGLALIALGNFTEDESAFFCQCRVGEFTTSLRPVVELLRPVELL